MCLTYSRRPRCVNDRGESVMNMHEQKSMKWKKAVLASALAGVIATGAVTALAGECPADKVVPDGQGAKPVTTAAKGVTDVVRSSTDLGKESIGASGYLFRLRQLDIQPGGIVPWHSHGDRPAMIYMVKGTAIEYSSSCAVPIVHKAGDVAPEKKGTSHWWENKGTEPVVLISVDILHEKKEEHMM
jgi:quercetin dioxygenase-like cupin family protein